ncbi:13977_t:CDS:2 [Entrophospora sp. SA101]|nr:11581_t:CDS:2 [Entrophospora sp. SA101]CAJ0626312.1 13971_t:CDS:2 [Entrophospora sp. SA101]CAJ0626323.1 13977_t:CDS:2 [Entrophospora sp. SA101]CAJ0823680.1 16676_t:CDS:2 [Entrophospora sp. SA101]CAJ0835974.1 13460_t:CDS:2 [Entrophospora sp. SA101]
MASLMFSSALKRQINSGLAKKFARPFATEISSIKQQSTRTTVLPSGLTIATESIPYTQTATVGVWIDAGSRAESSKNNGAAHFLEHMAFKGTNLRSQNQLELSIENIGAHLNAYTSREQTVYYAKTFQKDAHVAVEILSDILQNSTLDEGAIERERDVILREQEEVDKQFDEVKDDLANYIKNNYTTDRMVLVGTGGIDHDELVKLAEKHFSSLPSSPSPLPLGSGHGEKPSFVGSEVRIRNDELSQAHIALAVESVGWNSPDYYTMLVTQAIIGTWDRSFGSAAHTSSRLSHIIHKHQLANSFQSFNTSYSDTGLFGIYLISENVKQLDDLIHFTLEVERAKQQLKSSLLLNLDGTTAVAEDIGRQMVTTGKRLTPKELETIISKITVDDIRRVAGEYLWDKDVAVVGLGPG